MKIAVTGSSGYIGSHFAKFFSGKRHDVYGLDRLAPSAAVRKYLKENLEGEIADREKVEPFLRKNGIEAVVHCAAYCLVGESVQKPDIYRDNNVVRAAKLADAAEAAGIKPFVFSSTAAVYGEPRETPIREDHPKHPVNPYGATKLEFEQELLFRSAAARLHVGILRYFNAAGADVEGELREIHDPETHLIPNAIAAALGKKPSFEVYGTDYPTRDGTCERDFIHVWDLADAHLRLLEKIVSEGKGGTFNLGTGKGYTVNEVLEAVGREAGSKVPRVNRPRRPGDPAILVADPSRAKTELGWTPAHSDLKTIVRSAMHV